MAELDALNLQLATLQERDVATLTLAGPLTLAQALSHVAVGVSCSMTGYPQPKPWLFRVTIGRLALHKFLRAGKMSHNLAAPIPGVAVPDLPPVQALALLQQVVQQFEAFAGPCPPHFAYGAVTKDQYAQLHAMHLADHLGGLGACRKSIACKMSLRLYTMNLLRSDSLLASQIFSTVQELPGVNPCSFGQLPPSSQTALGASRNTPTRS